MYYQEDEHMEMEDVFNKLVEHSCHIFEDKLTGVYLHGSIAMRCFNPMKSDIDILVVVEDAITNLQKKMFIDGIIALNDYLPAKGIEMSIVRRKHCKNFVYPTPFELHFSNMHLSLYKSNADEYIKKMNGTDYDLAAHFVIVKKRGIVLYGEEIDEVFGEVPSEVYLDSIKRDIVDAENQVIDNPIYIILNLCRVLAYVQGGLILSKKEGGEWGISNIDGKYEKLIKEALICYVLDQNMNLNDSLTVEFCKYMKNKIGLAEK